MAQTGNSSSAHVTTSNAITAPNRYSYHFFYRNTVAPGTGSVAKPLAIALSNYDVSFCWHHSSGGQKLFHRRSSGSYDSIAYTDLTSNTWYGLGGKYDGTNIEIYKNGTSVTTTASADPPTDAPKISALAGSGGTNNFDGGTICEVACWNAALTAAEFAALGKGISPLLVRPASLLVYWPLIRNITPYFGPAITSGSGLTVADHYPTMFRAFQKQTGSTPLAAPVPEMDSWWRPTSEPTRRLKGAPVQEYLVQAPMQIQIIMEQIVPWFVQHHNPRLRPPQVLPGAMMGRQDVQPITTFPDYLALPTPASVYLATNRYRELIS